VAKKHSRYYNKATDCFVRVRTPSPDPANTGVRAGF
jgi:hypothetical protein